MQLYVVRMLDAASGEQFFKVGVSTNASTRFSFGTSSVMDSGLDLATKFELTTKGQQYISDHPYEVETLHVTEFSYEGDARITERDLLLAIKPHQYWPLKTFPGESECFRCDEEALDIVVNMMDAAAAEAKANEPGELYYKLASTPIQIQRIIDPIDRHLAVLREIDRLKKRSGS